MGVIKRQSVKHSLVSYTAVLIGALSTIFIYPEDKATYGLARFVIDTASMISPLILLGFGGVTIRFFPQFKQDNKIHKGFLMFTLSAVLIGSILFLLLGFCFKDFFYGIYADKEPIYQQYLPYLIPLAILIASIQLFVAYSSNFKRIVVPSIYQNLSKISLPLLILFYVWGYLSLDHVVNGIFLNFAVALAGLILYVYWLGELKLSFDFSFLNKAKIKEIRSFALFSLFGGLGSLLAFRIDSLMISTLLDYDSNGVFAIAAFIANVIAIPTNAVNQIAAPIVSESFKNNDLDHIRKLYKDFSLNLLVIGLLFFICIILSIEDLISIMPKSGELTDAVAIVLIIGIAKLVDMGTSINNSIINYSKYYKFGFFALFFMAIFNIIANFLLIPAFQIVGAALATLASLIVYNLVKLIFIQWRFKMQPFSQKTLWVVLIAGVVYAICSFIPATGIAVLDIVLRSGVIIGIYTAAVLYFEISLEFRNILMGMVNRVRNFF